MFHWAHYSDFLYAPGHDQMNLWEAMKVQYELQLERENADQGVVGEDAAPVA